jgi:hypothetical protein
MAPLPKVRLIGMTFQIESVFYEIADYHPDGEYVNIQTVDPKLETDVDLLAILDGLEKQVKKNALHVAIISFDNMKGCTHAQAQSMIGAMQVEAIKYSSLRLEIL